MNENECPVCGADGQVLPKTIGKGYVAIECAECGFTWISRESIKKVAVEPVYDNYEYNENLTRQYERMTEKYLQGFRRRLAGSPVLSRRAPKELSFLDVGCANGEYLRTAIAAGIGEVSGVEIDQAALRRASRYADVVKSAADLGDKKFDLIQIKNVISNIDDFLGFLDDYVKRLKPSGVLWLDVLNQRSLLALLRNVVKPDFVRSGRFGPLRPPYVINGFTTRSLRALAEKEELVVDRLETSYLGSAFVPYSPPGVFAQAIRVSSSKIGMGSMLIADLRKPEKLDLDA